MNDFKKIRTAIIDDQQGFIETLKDQLSLFPDIELCECATNYIQASKILTNENLDLVFLDIEMPYKNGFELLKEARVAGGAKFSVIFCTAYDNFGIQAIRESAFSYILKPVRHEELQDTIERFKKTHKSRSEAISVPLFKGQIDKPEIIALPTYNGIQFVNINQILIFISTKSNLLGKSSWVVKLTDGTTIRLTGLISAKKILSQNLPGHFIQISQSCIINFLYLNIVEYKTHNCILFPPFEYIQLTISQSHLIKIKDRFDKF